MLGADGLRGVGDLPPFPIWAVPTTLRASGLAFTYRGFAYDVTAPNPRVLSFLQNHLDGSRSSDALRAEAVRQNVDPDEMVRALAQLAAIGVVCDASRLLVTGHYLTTNPMPFGVLIGSDEIAALVHRPTVVRGTGSRQSLVDARENPLLANLERRSTCRNFADSPITMLDIGVILRAMYSADLAPVPSAGALYPLELYVFARAVDGLGDGSVWFYDHSSDELCQLEQPVDGEDLIVALDSDWMARASAIVAVTANLSLHARKYSNRGYRYSLLEAGQVLQNGICAALSLDLATAEYGGFDDGRVARLLELPAELDPVALLAVGRPSGKARTQERQQDRAAELIADNGWTCEHVVWRDEPPPPFRQVVVRYGPLQEEETTRYSSGSASTSAMAETKAVMEAVERTVPGRLPATLVRSAADQLGDAWIGLDVIHPMTDAQIQRHGYARFSSSDPWEWIAGRSAVDACKRVWVPIDAVCYPLAGLGLGRKPGYETSSSGLAAHHTRKLAEENALAELVERDCVIRNWRAAEPPALILQDGLAAPALKRVSFIRSLGYALDIADLSDHGAHVVSAMAHDPARWPAFTQGSSASFRDSTEALCKALDECILGIVHQRNAAVEDLDPTDVRGPDDHGFLYFSTKYVDKLSYLFAGPVQRLANTCRGPQELLKDVVFVDLDGQGEPPVVRALCPRLVPIGFGYDMDHLTHPDMPKRGRALDGGVLFPHYLS